MSPRDREDAAANYFVLQAISDLKDEVGDVKEKIESIKEEQAASSVRQSTLDDQLKVLNQVLVLGNGQPSVVAQLAALNVKAAAVDQSMQDLKRSTEEGFSTLSSEIRAMLAARPSELQALSPEEGLSSSEEETGGMTGRVSDLWKTSKGKAQIAGLVTLVLTVISSIAAFFEK